MLKSVLLSLDVALLDDYRQNDDFRHDQNCGLFRPPMNLVVLVAFYRSLDDFDRAPKVECLKRFEHFHLLLVLAGHCAVFLNEFMKQLHPKN